MTESAGEALPVFAYGTLKQGFLNHASYCRGALDVMRAEVWGRLYVWRPGIPILQVRDEDVLVTGTRDLAHDLGRAAGILEAGVAPARRPAGRSWRRIQGEILVFPDPQARLRLLDAFEGVHPATSTQPYERALCRVRLHEPRGGHPQHTAAWGYVLPGFAEEPARRLDVDTWHPELGA